MRGRYPGCINRPSRYPDRLPGAPMQNREPARRAAILPLSSFWAQLRRFLSLLQTCSVRGKNSPPFMGAPCLPHVRDPRVPPAPNPALAALPPNCASVDGCLLVRSEFTGLRFGRTSSGSPYFAAVLTSPKRGRPSDDMDRSARRRRSGVCFSRPPPFGAYAPQLPDAAVSAKVSFS